MSFWSEFKDFAVKGNVIDMAVGVVIGTAFSKVVSSLVSDIIMPIVSIFTDSISFAEWKVVLRKATATEPAVTLNYGIFIDSIVNLLIIALSIFLAIKLITRAKDLAEETVNSVIPPDFSLDKLESMIIGDNKANVSVAQLNNPAPSSTSTSTDSTSSTGITERNSPTQQPPEVSAQTQNNSLNSVNQTPQADLTLANSNLAPEQNQDIATQQLILLTQIRDLLNKQLNPTVTNSEGLSTSLSSQNSSPAENQDKSSAKA